MYYVPKWPFFNWSWCLFRAAGAKCTRAGGTARWPSDSSRSTGTIRTTWSSSKRKWWTTDRPGTRMWSSSWGPAWLHPTSPSSPGENIKRISKNGFKPKIHVFNLQLYLFLLSPCSFCKGRTLYSVVRDTKNTLDINKTRQIAQEIVKVIFFPFVNRSSLNLNIPVWYNNNTSRTISVCFFRHREWATCTLKALSTKTWSRRTFSTTPIKSWSQTSGCLGSLGLFRKGGKKRHSRGLQNTNLSLECCSHCTAITWRGPVICNNCWGPQRLQSCRHLPLSASVLWLKSTTLVHVLLKHVYPPPLFFFPQAREQTETSTRLDLLSGARDCAQDEPR